MAQFAPRPDPGLRDYTERIARRLLDQYADAESRILATTYRRLTRGLPARASDGDQLRVVRELQVEAQRILADVPVARADELVLDAARRGSAAAAAQLGVGESLSRFEVLSASQVRSVSMISQDLRNAFQEVHLRVLRYPVDAAGVYLGSDVFQEVVARSAPAAFLEQASREQVRQYALREFLEQGITGFVDRGGRRWTIGSYTEMATRTATARAYTESSVQRMQAAGVNLVSILGNNDACPLCAPWFGKVLSTDGTPPGRLQVPAPHDPDELVTVDVAARLDDARAQGLLHPNCACTPVAYVPGFDIAVSAAQHSPELEKASAQQRSLERRKRGLKQREALAIAAGDAAGATRARSRIRKTESEIRDLVAEYDLVRKYEREQVAWDRGLRKEEPIVPEGFVGVQGPAAGPASRRALGTDVGLRRRDPARRV